MAGRGVFTPLFGALPEHALPLALTRGWTVTQTKSLSSGTPIPTVTTPFSPVTLHLQILPQHTHRTTL